MRRLLAFALLTACGPGDVPADRDTAAVETDAPDSDEPVDPVDPSLSLEVDPATLELPPGGSGTVALTLQLRGVELAAELSATAPDGVSVAFDGAGSARTATVEVDAAVPVGTYTVRLHASAGSVSDEATLSLVVVPFTVRGRVHSLQDMPRAGAEVRVGGLPPVTSAADGTFEVEGVSPPYDVVVSADDWHVVYLDVRRQDPVLHALERTPLPARTDVSGQLTGGVGTPLPAGHVNILGIAPRDTIGVPTLSADGQFSWPLFWYDGGARVVTLHATQVQRDGAARVTHVHGYGSRQLTIAQGGTFTNQVIALAPVEARLVSGTLELPQGAEPSFPFTSLLTTADGAELRIGSVPEGAFQVMVPGPPGGSVGFALSYRTAGGEGYLRSTGHPYGATGLLLQPSAPPLVREPAQDANGVDASAVFRVDAVEEAVYLLMVSPLPSAPPTVLVVTGEVEVPLARLEALGITLLADQRHTVTVSAHGPWPSFDAALVERGAASEDRSRDGYWLQGRSTYFRTAP